MNISNMDGPSLGPPDLPNLPNYPAYHHPSHIVDGSASNRNSTSPNDNTRRPRVVPGADLAYSRDSPLKRSGSVSDDGNRSRNAKAQRRHREKRKAQLKLLEHRVVELEAQCESLTHKLGQCVSEGRGPVPSIQEFEAMQAENAYLRQENQELRRQMGGGRPPFTANGMPPPLAADGSKSGDGSRFSGEYGPQSNSPRAYDRVNVEYGHESGSNSSGLAHMDSMTPMSRHSRSRPSVSSGVTPSPYIPSSSTFPSDPRHHTLDGRYSSSSGGSGNGNGTYEHPGYHGPPPHTMPRASNGMMYPGGADDGFSREGETWSNGPPPFTSQVSYPMYPDTPGAPPHHEYPAQTNHHDYADGHA